MGRAGKRPCPTAPPARATGPLSSGLRWSILDAGTYPGLHEEPPCCSFSDIFKGDEERRDGERTPHMLGSGGPDGLSGVQFSDNSCCQGVARADKRQDLQPEEAHSSCTGGWQLTSSEQGPALPLGTFSCCSWFCYCWWRALFALILVTLSRCNTCTYRFLILVFTPRFLSLR